MIDEPETRVRPSNQRWKEIERLLDLALERPADERRSFLEQACTDDPALLEEVNRLLRSCERPEAWLDGQAPIMRRLWWAKPRRARPPKGSGSAPTGSSARRGAAAWAPCISPSATTTQFRKRVALKLMRARPGTDEHLVAPLHRGAADPRLARAPRHRPPARRRRARRTGCPGSPWSTSRACRSTASATTRRLTIDARLELFLQVCDAVQYAHQHLSSTATSSRRTSWSRPTAR